MKTIALHSDFRDYYDHWFSGSWETPNRIFSRKTIDGPLRSDMFRQLEDWGLETPRNGIVKQLAGEMAQNTVLCSYWVPRVLEVVVYTDESKHCGEGKLKLTLQEALEQHPNHFASEYIRSHAVGAESLRYLRIGSRQFWLRYTSKDDWRSNCGDVQIEVLREEQTITPNRIPIPYPLFAIDFVLFHTTLYAVDFNVAPGLKGTGVEEILTGNAVYQEIANWFRQQEMESCS